MNETSWRALELWSTLFLKTLHQELTLGLSDETLDQEQRDNLEELIAAIEQILKTRPRRG